MARSRRGVLLLVAVACALAACNDLPRPIRLFGPQQSNDSPDFKWFVTAKPCGCEPLIEPRPTVAPYTGARNKRVLLIGDSMMVFAATEVRKTLENLRLVDHAQVVNRSWNGALLGSSFNWEARLRDFLDTYRPDIVIAHFRGADGDPTRAFEQSQRMVDIIRNRRAHAVWTIPPTVYRANTSPGTIYEAYATKLLRLRGATLVDADRWISPHNRFWWYLRFPGEGYQNMRLDFIHTSNRADWVIAELTASAIRSFWRDPSGTTTATTPASTTTTTSPTTTTTTTSTSTTTTSSTTSTTSTTPAPPTSRP